MSLFNESFRKLRHLFEEEEDEAGTPDGAPDGRAGAPHPASQGALRAEARRKRKADMRERLAAMIAPDGTVTGGIVRFVSLFPIAAAVGERWPIAFPKAEAMSESVIRRELDADDLWAVHGDQGFALIFTDPDLTEEEANLRCERIFEAIREHLLGTKPVARPRYTVDARLLLRAFDEDGTPPLHMTDPPEPPGAWVPPATLLAGRDAYLPPDSPLRAADAAWIPPQAGPVPEPEKGPIAPPPAETAAADPEVGRSGERIAREPEWIFPTVAQRQASMADWSGGWDDDIEVPRSHDRPVRELVLLQGETREQAVARYVTMGRFNTLFDGIAVRFRSFWAHRQRAVALFLADPLLRADDVPADAATLIRRADEVAALAALDRAVLSRTLEAVVPRIEAGARFFFAVPVSFTTLLRRGDRFAYFDQWAAVPAPVRQLGRFACYESVAGIGDSALGAVVGMLARAGQTPMFTCPSQPALLDRLRALRVKLAALDTAGADADPARFEQACAVVAAAPRYGIMTCLTHLPAALREKAVTTEASLIEGTPVADAAALPARPQPLPAEAFAAGE